MKRREPGPSTGDRAARGRRRGTKAGHAAAAPLPAPVPSSPLEAGVAAVWSWGTFVQDTFLNFVVAPFDPSAVSNGPQRAPTKRVELTRLIPMTPLAEGAEAAVPAGPACGKAAEEEEEEVEDPWQDRKLMLLSSVTQLAGLYAASQACWLAVFVPQVCPPVDETFSSPWFGPDDIPLNPADHVCSVSENLDWYNNTSFNNLCLVTNCITFVLYIYSEFSFWRRETFIIGHLDERRDKPYDNLRAELAALDAARGKGEAWEAPLELPSRLARLHTHAYFTARLLLLCLLVNLGINCKLLFIESYLSERTTTTLATNMLLVSSKVAGYVMAARESATDNLSISMYSSARVSYNLIEAEHKAACMAQAAAARAAWENGGAAAAAAAAAAAEKQGAERAGREGGKAGRGDAALADAEAGRGLPRGGEREREPRGGDRGRSSGNRRSHSADGRRARQSGDRGRPHSDLPGAGRPSAHDRGARGSSDRRDNRRA